MIITVKRIVRRDEISSFGWAGLRRFTNVNFTAEVISELHRLPSTYRSNVKKQASQIKDCLIQAEEYFKASTIVSLATKPVLLYYGIMSLALAEILLKQSGNSSLDKARGEHAHHGLDFKMDGVPNAVTLLSSSGELLRAVPLVKSNGNRYGTFDLWHRSSREIPAASAHLAKDSDSGATKSYYNVTLVEDERMPLLDNRGITLLECLRHMPGMIPVLNEHGVRSHLARGEIETYYDYSTKNAEVMVLMHPEDQEILNKIYEDFSFHSSDFEIVEISEFRSGFKLKIAHGPDYPLHGFRIPTVIQQNTKRVYFCSGTPPLNEFGMLYASLFISGNYCRYYPDFRMNDVENSTSLALSIEQLLRIVEHRAPILAYGEMTRSATLIDE